MKSDREIKTAQDIAVVSASIGTSTVAVLGMLQVVTALAGFSKEILNPAVMATTIGVGLAIGITTAIYEHHKAKEQRREVGLIKSYEPQK